MMMHWVYRSKLNSVKDFVSPTPPNYPYDEHLPVPKRTERSMDVLRIDKHSNVRRLLAPPQ